MIYRFFLIAVLILIVFGAAPEAYAHGEDPRLEISPEQINPGSVLEIRGVDFEFEEQVMLTLVGLEGETPLGTIAADTEGIFHHIITIPPDLPEGTYTILAKTDDHALSQPFTVSGVPANQMGGQGLRDEEDGLLAPMPTSQLSKLPVGTVPTVSKAIPAPTFLPSNPAGPQTSPASGLARLALVVGGAILLGIAIILVRKR